MLGIRIDCFSVAGRAFAAGAYYIFLNRPPVITTRKKGETGAQIEIKRSWVLHRHTLPPFVPVKELCARYLTAAAVVPRDLNVLVGVLRRYVSSYHRREDAIVQLGRDNKAFVARVTMPDAEGLEARVYLKGDGGAGGGGVVDIRFDEGGGISSVRARDDVGRRIYALERKVKGAGRVERVRFGEG